MPFSRNRKVVPLWVPWGIFSEALPNSVGTSIVPPSVASVNLIGISQKRLSSCRSKSSCSLTERTMYRSPDWPPARPASPFPEERRREPLSTPAGMRTFSLDV